MAARRRGNKDTKFVIVSGDFSLFDADYWDKSDLSISSENSFLFTDYFYSETFINQELFSEEDIEKSKETVDDIFHVLKILLAAYLFSANVFLIRRNVWERVTSFQKGY